MTKFPFGKGYLNKNSMDENCIICYVCDKNGSTKMIDISVDKNKFYKTIELSVKAEFIKKESQFPKYILFKWYSDTLLYVYIFRNQLQNTPRLLNKWVTDSALIQSQLDKNSDVFEPTINICFRII